MICPKCKRPVEQSGELDSDGDVFAVFQCDECITTFKMGDEDFDANFTWAVNTAGQCFDAETLEPLNLN